MIDGVFDIFEKGGVIMAALLIVSLVLYDRCFNLLFQLHRFKSLTLRIAGLGQLDPITIRERQKHLEGFFQQNLIKIRALIAACPLLGLLGTVIGMIETFETLARESGESSIHGLSSGISMALVTTETGLAIAIPSMIILYYAQRKVNRIHRVLAVEEERAIEARAI